MSTTNENNVAELMKLRIDHVKFQVEEDAFNKGQGVTHIAAATVSFFFPKDDTYPKLMQGYGYYIHETAISIATQAKQIANDINEADVISLIEDIKASFEMFSERIVTNEKYLPYLNQNIGKTLAECEYALQLQIVYAIKKEEDTSALNWYMASEIMKRGNDGHFVSEMLIEDIHEVIEEKENEDFLKVNRVISVPVQTANIPDASGNIYSPEVLKQAAEDYNERIEKQGFIYGELRPKNYITLAEKTSGYDYDMKQLYEVKADQISHQVFKLYQNENGDLFADITFKDTRAGKALLALFPSFDQRKPLVKLDTDVVSFGIRGAVMFDKDKTTQQVVRLDIISIDAIYDQGKIKELTNGTDL